tara:strand:+ start:901 stop:1302 length:402 start_codon:yes stop_codon:yes gene_type:complete
MYKIGIYKMKSFKLLGLLFIMTPLFSSPQYIDYNNKIIALHDNGTWEYINENVNEIVYVNKTGKMYHKKNCRQLTAFKKPLDVYKASIIYSHCETCNPPKLTMEKNSTCIKCNRERKNTKIKKCRKCGWEFPK